MDHTQALGALVRRKSEMETRLRLLECGDSYKDYDHDNDYDDEWIIRHRYLFQKILLKQEYSC